MPIDESLDDLEWRGAHRGALTAMLEWMRDDKAVSRIKRWVE